MATGKNNEELLIEVQGSIYPLDLAALVNLAEYLKVTKIKYKGKSRLSMTKLLCNFLEEKMAESESVDRLFPKRLTNGGTFNNRLLFTNNRLFSLLFSGNFCGGTKALMEGDKVVMGVLSVPPSLAKALAEENNTFLLDVKSFILGKSHPL